jgi:hypothetical protein
MKTRSFDSKNLSNKLNEHVSFLKQLCRCIVLRHLLTFRNGSDFAKLDGVRYHAFLSLVVLLFMQDFYP